MSVGSKRAESRCRLYTREEAKRLGWDIRHSKQGGQFLEEQDLVELFPVLKRSLGTNHPDFGALGRDGSLRTVIECNNDVKLLDQSVAQACEYADAINGKNDFEIKVAVGVAGTPDTFVQTRAMYFDRKKRWTPLISHGFKLTQLPTLTEIEIAISNNDGTTDVQLPDEAEFFDSAIAISRILRLAKIPDADRPKVVGAIVLALFQSDFSLDSNVVLDQINSNVKAAIDGFKEVPCDQRDLLANTFLLSSESHPLRPAIRNIVHQLDRLNVRSIMRSGVDFLGKFYETFLRYGCDAKSMGIVFTPRHITKLCADLVDVRLGMTAYDAASGTGGFLVAALDRMMGEATTRKARQSVKTSLWGCETNPTVWALAVLNMLFRGDGANHIEFKSCFDSPHIGKFQRALLNPPYSQQHEPETKFIDHALASLVPGGELAVVAPTRIVVDEDLRSWRKSLVSNHHFLGSISLPSDLFYPTSAPTCIMLIRAHTPDLQRGTFVAKIHNDGYEISKKRRVPIAGEQLADVLRLYREYHQCGTIDAVDGLACVIPRDLIADGAEVCAEEWLPSAKFALGQHESRRQEIVRQMSLAIANYPEITEEFIDNYEQTLGTGSVRGRPTTKAKISDWFEIRPGKSMGEKSYPGGETPFISSGDAFNSIVGFIQPPDDEVYIEPVISMTGFGQAYLQPWRFCARGNGGSAVKILTPRFAMSLAEFVWLAGQINAQKWRFHYGRMASVSRISNLRVDPFPADLPIFTGLERKLQRFRDGVGEFFRASAADDVTEKSFNGTFLG